MHAELPTSQCPGRCSVHTNSTPPLPLEPGSAVQLADCSIPEKTRVRHCCLTKKVPEEAMGGPRKQGQPVSGMRSLFPILWDQKLGEEGRCSTSQSDFPAPPTALKCALLRTLYLDRVLSVLPSVDLPGVSQVSNFPSACKTEAAEVRRLCLLTCASIPNSAQQLAQDSHLTRVFDMHVKEQYEVCHWQITIIAVLTSQSVSQLS